VQHGQGQANDRLVASGHVVLFVMAGFDPPGALGLRMQVRPARLEPHASRAAQIRLRRLPA
jgi:hypothetical protein